MAQFVSNTVQVHIYAFDHDDQVLHLLLQRADDNPLYPLLWQALTGTIETGETALQTSVREIKEETSLSPIKMWTVPYITSFFDPYSDRVNFSPVFGALVEYHENIILSGEHKDFIWLKYEEALKKPELPTHVEGTKVFQKYIIESKGHSKFEIPEIYFKQLI